jgi:glycine/D-amino acid oxidase-like deaminating enzyme
MSADVHVAIVGAGPYSLATAAHLRQRGIEALVLGQLMGAWEQMPHRMLLRSFREASNIGDPHRRLTLGHFERDRHRPVESPISVRDFVEYGRWFHAQAAPQTDERLVRTVEQNAEGFRLWLDDGAEVAAANVVVAAGIEPFLRIPPAFDALEGLVTHSSRLRDFESLRGHRVLVVGGGQSALEWAALAHEAGADVEVISRRPLRFLRGDRVRDRAGVFRGVLYPSFGVGPPGLNWLMGLPDAYRRLPPRTAQTLAYRAIRPAGAAWLQGRLDPIRITTGVSIRGAYAIDGEVSLLLDDGSERRAERLIAATGYQVDVARYVFLDRNLLDRVRLHDGFPALSRGYESTLPGLYFVGATAAASMGPGMRFVSHSGIAAAAVARDIARG